MDKISVMMVDDSPIFLEGLCTVIEYGDPRLHVVTATSVSEEAMEKFKEFNPDVILLDIKMPGKNGVELAREMLAWRPDIKIIMLTTFDDTGLITEAMRAGAKGYYLKDAPADQIIEAIKNVYAGSVLMASKVAEKLLNPVDDADVSRKKRIETDHGPLSELSIREVEILRKIGQGKTNTEIAGDLFLSEKTVRNYVSHIYEVMGFTRRSKAVIWSRENEKLLY